MRPKPKRSGLDSYFCDFRHNGQRYRKRFSLPQYTEPRRACEQFIESVLFGSDGPGAIPSQSARTLRQNAMDFLRWYERAQCRSQKRVDRVRRQLLSMVAFLEDQKVDRPSKISLESVRALHYGFHNPQTWERYAKPSRRVEEGRARQATWGNYRIVLSMFFDWMIEEKTLSENLARRSEFRPRRPDEVIDKVLTSDQTLRLLKAVDLDNIPVYSLLFRILAYTGMRIGEALRLDWSDIDLEKRVILIDGPTKTGRARSVYIADALYEYLTSIASEQRPDLTSANRRTAHDHLRRALRNANLPPIRLHDLRHGFGSHLYREGVGLVDIKEMLGHSQLRTTMRYVHTNQDKQKEAIGKLPY